MTHEEQYIAESGDKKPDFDTYKNKTIWRTHVIIWYKRFIKWLSHRLERVEKENEEQKELMDFIDCRAPKADITCSEPGIGFIEACRRELKDIKKS
jgi:hypothetical protein